MPQAITQPIPRKAPPATPTRWPTQPGVFDRCPLVIAELGVNHDGSITRALEMVDAAARARADAVKLQLFRAEGLMSRASRLAGYQKEAGEKDPVAMLARLELSENEMAQVVARAHALGIAAIVTVFSIELVPVAERLGFDAYKTASPDIIHLPLLHALAATGKPLIISTGAATLAEVHAAIDTLAHARDRITILQCVSSYPTPDDDAELGGIIALASALGVAIGYSDHTESTRTGATAVGLGARVLEKHFTYSRDAQGPDHRASLEEPGMAEYITLARAAPVNAAVGQACAPGSTLPIVKRVLPIEQDVRSVSRQSIVARHALTLGSKLTRNDLTFKRPGTGLPPALIDSILGQRLTRDVPADTPLQPQDLAHA